MSKNKKRIDLLSQAEIEELYARPLFNDDERRLYFTLSEKEALIAKNYFNVKSRLYFILQLGYFKARQQFYAFSLDEVIEDAIFISNLYFDKEIEQSGIISREYIKKQQTHILELYKYSMSGNNREKIMSYLCSLIRIYPKGHNALRQLIIYLDQQHIIIPTYRTLQDLFTEAYRQEKDRLVGLLSLIPEEIKNKLKSLIKNDNGFTELNAIRSDQKDFQYTAVKLEVEKTDKISSLYQFSILFIPKLGISRNAIQYYSEITEQYPASRLRRLKQAQQWLHLICFVHYRYQQFMDNLIKSFMYHVRTTMTEGKTYAEVAQLEHGARLSIDFPKLAEFLKWFPEQKNRPNVTYSELSQDAYRILPEEQFLPLSELIAGNTFDKKAARWEFYGKSSRLFALYLRPILTTVDFEFYEKDHPIMEMIKLLKNHYRSGKPPSSLKLCDDLGLTVPKNMVHYLKANPQDKYIDPHRFEFFVYEKMYHHLDRGRMFCNNSITYRDLDCDLVSEKVVDDIVSIAKKFGFSKIPIYCDSHLDAKLAELDAAWKRTTEGIDSGCNKGIKITLENAKPRWTLLYDSSEKPDDKLFGDLPKSEILNVIKFVGDGCNMWDKFSHAKSRYIKRENPNPVVLNACILAEAFGFSMEKMAEMSDLNYNTLRSTREDFFNIIALSETNDTVADYVHSLPIFSLWNLVGDKLLGDADGQKISSTNDTIQSRYSKKFLGKGKGISIYTLLANFVAVNATTIGPNEYEGHSLYDMIYGNKTEIAIDMVTGDNHSLNKYNFVFLDSIDVEYVPSIKNIREAADDLYSAKPIDNYQGLIKPKGQINIDRIKSEKKGILRVLLSLLMQDNTQTTIVRKLNSHARYVRLRAGLLEYNRLLKSTHVLNLIHYMQLRKAIKGARNRTESYHSLQGLIRKMYNGIFKGKKIVNNRISAHATRLVANCIVAYNAIILNSIYEKMLKEGVSAETLKEFARISPIAWSHLIFTGRYNFAKNDGNIDITLFVDMLEEAWRERFGLHIELAGPV